MMLCGREEYLDILYVKTVFAFLASGKRRQGFRGSGARLDLMNHASCFNDYKKIG